MKVIPHLHKQLPRIQKMRPAKRKAVVQQNTAVRNVHPVQAHRKSLAERFAQRHVKRCVTWLMDISSRRRISVRKSRRIVDIRREKRSPRQCPLPAHVQRVALVVVKQSKPVAQRKIRQPAVDIPESERELIRVRQINLPAIVNSRGTQRQLPTVDARALNRDWKKHFGVVQVVVVEEILRARQKVIRVDRPPEQWNRDAKLMLLIALAMQRNEAQILLRDEIDQRAAHRTEWRRLVKMPVESAEHPIQLGYPDGRTDARVGRVLDDSS